MSPHPFHLSVPMRTSMTYLAIVQFFFFTFPDNNAAQLAGQRPLSAIYPETSSAAEALLKTAASHARQAQWDSAIELYQRAISQFPGSLTSLAPADEGEGGIAPADGLAVFVNVSEYAQNRISRLPPEALNLYRSRVDDEARRLYEQGLDRLDPEPLQRVVTTYFCSTWGDESAELLADMAFQDGRFDEASGLYRRLLPDSDRAHSDLIYPDPSIDIPRVVAKAILCDQAAGYEIAPEVQRRFAQNYPDSEGQLAGRNGNYSQILDSVLREDDLHLAPSSDARWPTFAGHPTRSKVISEPVAPGPLVWSIPLRATFDSASNLNAQPPRFGVDVGIPQDESPTYFPSLQGGELFLTDGRSILSFALDGSPGGLAVPAPTWRATIPPGSPSTAQPAFGVERHTLTIHGRRIYARLGPFGAEYQLRNNTSVPMTAVVAMDRSQSDVPIWSRTADEVIADANPANAAVLAGQVAFGGAPLADDHGVYVTMMKPGTQILVWVVCLDPDTGRTNWIRYVCSGTSSMANRNAGARNRGLISHTELGDRLLSLGGSSLYFQTDLGALASIEGRSGRLNWLSTYPRVIDKPRPASELVNHNPAVVHSDRVIISPEDADRIFAFDRATGRLAWQVDPGGRVSHLLGVVEGKVVATGNHVWTIDVHTGEIRSRWPEGQSLEQGYGRGILADGEIYWPTRDLLYILDQSTGRPTDRPPIYLREAYGCGGGNLVAGDGFFVIAERDHLRVFCNPARMIRFYQERIEAEPDEPSHYYRLARTAIGLGDHQLALENLDRALKCASPGDRIDGSRLIEAARAERYRILMVEANRLSTEGDAVSAIAHFTCAAESASNLSDRLKAELARSDAIAAAGDSVAAVGVLQSLLDRPEILGVDLPVDERRNLRAELLIADRLRAIVSKSGPEVYAIQEAKAADILRRGIQTQDPRLLAEVSRSYPASKHLSESIEAIGVIEEGRGAWAEAAAAYHQLVSTSLNDRVRAIGLLGMARAYESLGLSEDSQEAYRLASTLYGEVEIRPSGHLKTVNEIVADRLSAIDTGSNPRASRMSDSLLLERTTMRCPEGFAPLLLDEAAVRPLGAADRPAVLLGDTELIGVDPGSGNRLWTSMLSERPTWSGIVGDRLIVSTPERIAGINPTDGTRLWEVSSEDGGLALSLPIQNQEVQARPKKPSTNNAFHEFRLHGERIFFLRGDRELVCFDPIAGQPVWTYRSSSIAIHPRLGLGLARVIVQLRNPNAIAVLDARDGRTVGLFPQNDSAGEWRRDPFPVSLDRVALVPDGESVVLFDLLSGRAQWEIRDDSPLPSSPSPSLVDPLILGDAERLLVLRGETIQRIDPTDGKLLWSAGLGRIRSDRRSEAMVLGHEVLYYLASPASGLSVGAISLSDGALSWSESLPGDVNECWGLGLTRECVVAYRLDDGTPGTDLDEPVLLNLLRRDCGRRIQRLVVDVTGPDRSVQVGTDVVTITGSNALWCLETREQVDHFDPTLESGSSAGDRLRDSDR